MSAAARAVATGVAAAVASLAVLAAGSLVAPAAAQERFEDDGGGGDVAVYLGTLVEVRSYGEFQRRIASDPDAVYHVVDFVWSGGEPGLGDSVGYVVDISNPEPVPPFTPGA